MRGTSHAEYQIKAIQQNIETNPYKHAYSVYERRRISDQL